jgi:rhodanese-related sulfurtransferase
MALSESSTSPFLRLDAAALHDALAAHSVILVDVREPKEFEAARIAGAVNLPLSCFDPATLPAGDIVLVCAAGIRSLRAAALCAEAGMPVRGHLEGGLNAWVGAGLPLSSG